MTGPWPWPIGWVVRGAALAAAAGLVYLLARRAGPRAGASAASWGLVLLAAQPALLLVPWPRLEIPLLRQLDGPTTPGMPAPSPPGETAAATLPTFGDDGEGGIAGLAGFGDERPDASEVMGSRPSHHTPGPAAVGRPRPSWNWRTSIGVGLAALMVLGFARLAAGVWALGRLRRGASPVDDASLIGLVDALTSELSMGRGVEIRETARLSTPATFGWHRPIVLLPDDWRSWDAAELRAVLAHELAHVRGRDYPAALLAQLGVALHPYNPIVRWLSARLRLDQELDADATAARLSGGRRPYLACLARLALRRDDRAATWPAQAFLPIRGTFERRIEMLRHDRSPDRGGPTRPIRVLTIASLAASAVLCTGLRGPDGPDAVDARPQDDAPRAVASEGFDLSLVPQDAAFVAAIRPAALAGQPELKELIEQVGPMQRFAEKTGLSIADLEQLTIVELRRRERADRRGPLPVATDLLIIRTVDPMTKDELGTILADSEAIAFLGTTYHRSRGGPELTFRADDRTLIVSEDEPTLRYVIAGRNRPVGAQLWQEAVEQVGDGQLLVAFETPWLVQRLDDPGRARAGLDDPIGLVGPMLDRAYAYAIGLDVLDGVAVGAVALCADEEGAGRVAETASALRTLARNALGASRSRAQDFPEAAEAIGAAIGELEGLLDAATIETEGATVLFRAQSDRDPAALARLVAPPIAASRVASRRMQAMNNLKMIALALHNYHDTHGSFPPPVLYSDEGTPYSWRVAILPYLEQSPLYDRYRFDEPWDGPNNRELLQQMPAVFDVPGSDNDPTHADVFALVGPATLMGEPGKGTSIRDITDGTSNTIMVVESKRPVHWTQPEDIRFDSPDPDYPPAVPELGGFWQEGFLAALGDGSVRIISKTIDQGTLHALLTRNGGEVVSIPPL